MSQIAPFINFLPNLNSCINNYLYLQCPRMSHNVPVSFSLSAPHRLRVLPSHLTLPSITSIRAHPRFRPSSPRNSPLPVEARAPFDYTPRAIQLRRTRLTGVN